MIPRIVAFAVRSRGVVLAFAVIVFVTGFVAFRALPIEAYPNPIPPLVEVIAQPPGWSAEESERYVAIPLETELAGMPGLEHIRSQSLFGLVDVKCYFSWDVSYKDARQEVINRLQALQLPAGIQAGISPWNPLGEIFRYRLVDRVFERTKEDLMRIRDPGEREAKLRAAREHSLLKLKTIQDWVLERQFRQVPGVADVTGFGGLTKAYRVEVDPQRLLARAATLDQVATALANANQNVGGERLVVGEQSYTVRGVGVVGARAAAATFESAAVRDLDAVVLREENSIPLRVADVASVAVGWKPRLGIIGNGEDDDIVEGIVLMRYDAQTDATAAGVQERLAHIREYLLPPEQGVEIVPIYDRRDLTHLTTHTVLENLLFGMGLVVVVLVLFLGSVRGALITAVNIPGALLIAFSGMVATGTSANLLSLGAVDFGIVVDSTVIVMESIVRHLGGNGGSIGERIVASARQIGRPMAFSTLIIAVAFLPLFTMSGVAGAIFAPMARTYAFAIAGGIVLALTLTPALSTWAFRAATPEKESLAMRFMRRLYAPLFSFTLGRPRIAALGALAMAGVGVAIFTMLGGQFLPQLEEGNLWIRATLPTSVSLPEAAAHTRRMRDIVRRNPEVITVVSQVGRPDDGTDVAGFNNIEIYAPLVPFDEFPSGVTKATLTERLQQELSREFPGIVFNFSQYLSDNVEEALSGVKGENSLKVFGPEVAANEATARSIAEVMSHVRGIADLGVLHSMGQPSVEIVADRAALARYGLNTGDVESLIATGIAGRTVTQVFEGEKTFDVVVRLQEAYRNDVAAIRALLLPTKTGTVPLGQVASVTIDDSAAVIFREDGERYSPVKFSVRGRDLESTVTAAQEAVAGAVTLPPSAHLQWTGELGELEHTKRRLWLLVPLSLGLITLLTYAAVRSVVDTLVVLANLPIACCGGVVALTIAGEPFSVSAAMGFVSIIGISIQAAILIVTYAQRAWAEGMSIVDGARTAAEQRFRPVLMTTLVATLGLLPAALSHRIGAQVQKPLAIVVIGGSLTLALLTQLLLPPLLVLAHRRRA
ncbi:MAG: efflux RND transporter permease subunit [Deltaproteobacteria bacterium]|nr:efflux RND transporter permease subunit [Deltaproteobacteria bacterium]